MKLMPLFKTYKERDKWLTENATYFTLTWMRDLKHHTYYFSKLSTAQINARVAADHIAHKPVKIYAIYAPTDNPDIGYTTFVETIYPKRRVK